MVDEFKRFEVQQIQDVTVVHLSDPRLSDALDVSHMEEELLRLVDERQPPKLLVNFGRVIHCSTSVINALLRAKKKLIAQGGKLKLCGMRDTLREAYRILNLDGTVFEIYDSAAEGLWTFGVREG